MTRGRVRLITQWWAPEPIHVPEWMARGLNKAGWQVEVLTGIPNYPDGVVAQGYRASRYRREHSRGFPVRRAPLFPSHDGSPIRRMANYLSWAASASLSAVAATKVDVNLVYASPATAAIPAMLARLVRRTPYVMVVQDIWPDSVTRGGFLPPSAALRVIERVLNAFMRAAYAQAYAVIVISPGAIALLADRGVPREKLHLSYNWVDEDVFHPSERDPLVRAELTSAPDEFVLLYAGNLGRAQGLDTAIRALEFAPASAILAIAGDGVEMDELRGLAEGIAPGRVRFLGRRPLAEMSALSAAADAQLVILRDLPLYRTTMPSKVQAILASGSPILCAVAGDAAAVVAEAGAGVAVAPEDPRALGQAMAHLQELSAAERDELGRSGRAYYEREMAEAVGVGRLDRLLIHAARSRSSR